LYIPKIDEITKDYKNNEEDKTDIAALTFRDIIMKTINEYEEVIKNK
jgi:hypothetical protein